MHTSSQDITLFQSVQQGNRLAFNTLFLTYYSPLCQFAYQYVRNKEETEEIVSDVFFTLWQNRDRLSIDRSVKSYLYTCVKHAAIAAIKKRQPLFLDIDDLLTAQIADNEQPDRLHEFSEMAAYFQKAVDTLPLRCRQVFMLNRFDNLRYKEIGELLHISEKTVENQIVKALALLRERMQHYLTKLY